MDAIDVDLTSPDPNAEVRYTLDGTEPGPTSARYTGPIRVTQPVKLRARTFRDGYGSPTALSLDLSQGAKGYPNLAATGTPSASSVYPERDPQGNDIYAPARAFDGITYSWVGWAPAVGDRRPWLQVDLGAPARIRYIELYTRAYLDDPAARRNFEIRASNDPTFATFVVLAAQGSTSLPHEAVFEAEVTNAGTYRYIRAAKTADESFFVTELRVLGQR
ncbi:MAG: chitobiase/beta-hexosaminidase C-terminal domain-containing protein [Anaerolineae bacterium]|nr:chitobiase/beta-hexosaminidase C-terminal domain-containing protein [Candidatus Roseilinea sp.]MDW8451238.1 chitobiase/beta-hexosaminidase C-terminal domain-containing protein [Anaerolineae bacterium]